MMRNILEFLSETEKKYPNKIAFVDESNEISFHDLWERTLFLAGGIAFRGKRIAVIVENNIESILLMFAIILSGNCYVLIDRNMPYKRIAKMMAQADVSAVLSAKNLSEYNADIPFILLSELEQNNMEESLNMENVCVENDSCYLVFTSGSTGIPKAVVKSHKSIILAIRSYCEETGICEDDIIGNQAPLDYDAAAKDIYATVYTGATCVLIPRRYYIFPKMLMEYMAEQSITSIAWSAAAFSLTAEMKGLEKVHVPTLKRIMFSGAVLPTRHLMYWQSHYPEADFINLYGPTEITGTSAVYHVENIRDVNYELPLGNPLPRTEIVIVDEKRQRIHASGIVGEIVIISEYASDGYFDNNELSSDVFCPNIYTEGASMSYFTGDLGHFDEKGLIFFNGRRDLMIKHHGHRIELGEIEAAAVSFTYVKAVCCVYDDVKEKITLFYQSEEKMDKQLYNDLKELLPKYMLPGKFMNIKQMPMTRTGKIDRVALKEMYLDAKS